MSQPRRRDRYGAPMPELADASRQSLYDTPGNQRRRRHIQAVLEDTYRTLLRRDTDSAEVTVMFTIVRGHMQSEIRLGVVRQYRCTEE